MEKKILIVGAGKVGMAQISEILKRTGHNESEVVIVENSDDLKELVSFGTREVRQRLEIEKIETISYLPKNDYNNVQKRNSQCGWKNRPKHKR